ncbi:MAG TPA: hypothetical protein VF939_18260 [Puia sp.]
MTLQLLLVLHITGFTMMAGTVIANISIYRKLDRYLTTDKPKALIILESTTGLPILMGIGALLLLTTGIGMVLLFKGAVTSMLWFRIKMVLVLLILVNGAIIPRQNTAKLKILLAEKAGENNGPIEVLANKMSFFQITQLLMFLSIFVLSVFRF